MKINASSFDTIGPIAVIGAFLGFILVGITII